MDHLIIQLSSTRVTAARFGVSAGGLSFAGAAEFTLDHEQELPEVARRIAEGVSGAPRVVVCLAPSLVAQRPLSLPLGDLRKVREVLPSLMQGEIALPVEEVVFDALATADGRYLALWSRREEVRRVIELFREAGCEPQVVTCAPCAWPLVPGCPSDALVWDDEAVALVSGGRLACFSATGGSERARPLAATLAAFEAAGFPLPGRLLVIGEHAAGAAHQEGLPTPEPLTLPEALGSAFRSDETFQRLASALAVAQASHAGRLPDFRRGELSWTAGDAVLQRKLRVTALLAAIAVILLFGSLGLHYRTATRDIASLNGSIAALYREAFPNRPKAVDEISEVKGEIRKLSASSQGGAGCLELLKLLADAKGNIINGLYEVELDGRTARLKGDARSSQAVGDFRSALAPKFAAVDMGEVKSRPDGTVAFSMTVTLKEAKP